MLRLRSKHTTSLEERLAEEARRWREQAKLLPPGPERDELMRKANQVDAACHLNQWLHRPRWNRQGNSNDSLDLRRHQQAGW